MSFIPVKADFLEEKEMAGEETVKASMASRKRELLERIARHEQAEAQELSRKEELQSKLRELLIHKNELQIQLDSM